MMDKKNHYHRSENITITLEQLVPQDHLVRKIDAVIDVDFIYSAVENLYSENTGRPSTNPVLLIKMVLIQYTFSIFSIRRTIKDLKKQRGISFVFRSWSGWEGAALLYVQQKLRSAFSGYRCLWEYFLSDSHTRSRSRIRGPRFFSLTPPTSKQTRTNGSIRGSSFDAPHNSTKKNLTKKSTRIGFCMKKSLSP